MSKQIKASEKSPQTDRKNDFPLDKYLFRAATYGLTGFGVGLATSLFFKHKVPITAFFTGAGTGLGLQGVTQDWQSYERNKSWVKNQTQQRYSRGDDDDDSKGDRDSDNVNFDKYAQAQRNQEWSRLGQQKNEQKRGDQKEQDKDSSSKFERQDQKSNQEKADNQRQNRDQKEQDKDVSSKFERQDQKSNQEKANNQRQKRDQKEQDKDVSSKFERQDQKSNQEKADNQRQKRDQKEQDKDSSAKLERQGQKPNQEKADNQRQKRDQKEQDKDSSSKFERQAQQGKHEGKLNEQQGQQSKQQGQQARRQQQDKEEPLNPEAQYKKDIADRWTDFNKPLEKPEPKMGQGHDDYPFSQDKRKREEDTVYSQSMQGAEGGANEISRGEKGPQNSRIPPSQRDWTGGHANKGVQQQQVHRGAPEADKLGKSPRPDTEPNKNPDRGAPQQGNQALSNVDFKGQNLQTFQSNPLVLGKAGLTHEIQKNYQQGRNRANDPNLDNTRRRLDGLEQDIMGKSVKQGILFTQEEKSDTESGVHNYRPVAEQNLKNQVNAVLE